MRRSTSFIVALFLLAGPGLYAQDAGQPAAASNQDTAQLKQEINQMKKTIAAMEQRLQEQEKAAQAKEQEKKEETADLKTEVADLKERVSETERHGLLDRLAWSGDYRFEANTIRSNIPAHYDGMQLQSLMVKTLWLFAPQSQGGLGMPFNPGMLQQMTPAQFSGFIGQQVQQNYAQYQFFSGKLTFPQLKRSVGQFSPQMQQTLMNYLGQAPGVLQQAYNGNIDALFTNRLRLKFDAKVADNVSFTSRISMYKVFGDSTVAQVFNGQPNTLAIDGTTVGVPTGDMLRVDRAYFSWNNIGGSNFYLSIGRRPSTYGPPLNFREDEPRGGTPSGALIDYQFDGATFGYNVNQKMTLRACWGVGYSSGFGNGQLLQLPADRLKDVQFFGGNFDLYSTDRSFVQVTIARAWNVTDGFNGQTVLPNNPLTGDPITAPVVLRYTPSANLGAIDLYGLNLERTFGQFDLFVSGNMDALRPNGVTTPFGGLGSDPFQTPVDRTGTMIYAGVRYSIPQDDGRTKIGFEFNHGSKYWFNFAQAEDDIFMPKTATRGEVYETYLHHAINDHFIFKAGFQRFNYTWSGSGWHLGAPKKLDSTPILGFPTYDMANMFTAGLTARF
jgi:hypothetical protein